MNGVSFAECSARERIALLFDAGSFHEWLPPAARVMSPHLAQLGVPAAGASELQVTEVVASLIDEARPAAAA